MAFEPFDWMSLKPDPIIGVDEVGRGCLAGPVFAAAVILDPTKNLSYNDSKKISPSKRSLISDEIQREHRFSIGVSSVEEIEKINILKASLLAMKRAVLGLNVNGGHVLVDGKIKIPDLPKEYIQTTLIKGDSRAAPVAAASIVAKVARDDLLVNLSNTYPEYGFEKHKGYGTKVHLDAIANHGPCPEHRKLFAGVKEFVV